MRLTALLAHLVLTAAPGPAAPPIPAPPAVPEATVPFGCGLSFPVSQAHDTGSHLQHDTWAWDFRMPEGTPVVAAYDGVVRLARGDSNKGGCDARFAPYANYVVIDHQNGLETQYLHFSRVVVTAGSKVRAGELLGYSGKTGWACGAHLHFKVAVATGPSWNNPSVHARIAGYGDPQVDAEIFSGACNPTPGVQLVNHTPPIDEESNEPALGASPPAPAPKAAPKREPATEPATSAAL